MAAPPQLGTSQSLECRSFTLIVFPCWPPQPLFSTGSHLASQDLAIQVEQTCIFREFTLCILTNPLPAIWVAPLQLPGPLISMVTKTHWSSGSCLWESGYTSCCAGDACPLAVNVAAWGEEFSPPGWQDAASRCQYLPCRSWMSP